MNGTNRRIRRLVRISLPGQAVQDGFLFFRGLSKNRERPESLLELVNSSELFLPFERNADGLTTLISRSHLQWVAADATESGDSGDSERRVVIREELVTVQFPDGDMLKGLIVLELEDPTRRASDFLNGPEVFFRLETPEALYVVNKNAVMDVTVFETSPVPDFPAELPQSI